MNPFSTFPFQKQFFFIEFESFCIFSFYRRVCFFGFSLHSSAAWNRNFLFLFGIEFSQFRMNTCVFLCMNLCSVCVGNGLVCVGGKFNLSVILLCTSVTKNGIVCDWWMSLLLNKNVFCCCCCCFVMPFLVGYWWRNGNGYPLFQQKKVSFSFYSKRIHGTRNVYSIIVFVLF